MRRAKRLGLPGLIAFLLVVGGLFLGGTASTVEAGAITGPPGVLVGATGVKNCQQPINGGSPSGGPIITDCSLVITIPAQTPGGATFTVSGGAGAVSFTDILLDPNACFINPAGILAVEGLNLGNSNATNVCTGNSASTTVNTVVPIPVTVAPAPAAFVPDPTACPPLLGLGGIGPGGTGGGAAATTPSAGSGAVTVTCFLPPIAVVGPTSLCETVDLTLRGTVTPAGGVATPTFLTNKILVCLPTPVIPPVPVNPLTGVTVTKTCAPSFAGATPTATISTDCTLVFSVTGSTQFVNGTTLGFDTIQNPTAALFASNAAGGGGNTTTGCENGVGGGGVVSGLNQTFTCIVGPIIVSGPTTLCESVQLKDPSGNLSPKLTVCPPTPAGPPVNSGLGFTVVKNCTAPVPAVIQPGGTTVTDCTLVFTAAGAGSSFPAGTFVADDTITSPGGSFSSNATALNGIELTSNGTTGFCQGSPSTGTLSLTASGTGTAVVNGGFVLTCALPPIVLTTLPNQVCETVELGAPGLGVSSKTNVCGFTAPPPTPVVAPTASQPTDENKFCTNTASQGNLSQIIGGSSQNLSVTGPAKNFTLPLFGGASTCAIQIDRGTTGGVATPCSTTNACADGNIIVTLTSFGSSATIACAGSGLPPGQVLPAVSGGGGTCQQQALSTQLNIPCGVTAGTPAASTTVSNTCTGVLFDIQAALGACINSPLSACQGQQGTNFSNFSGGTATVTVEFLATPANGGTVGGIQLGTNNFTFQGAGIGTLLVTATPQLIPSNGTLASVVTATFGCGSGFSLTNGFPLSASGIAAANVNQPILGPSGLSGTSSLCGDGLPGTFNFTSPGDVLFDNGRQSESVSCGLNGQQNLFGGSNFFNPNGFNATAPLVFTCSGAAVLVIGAGVAGDAPINVQYTSAVGGLTAVGSTLITVSPSGVPRISVACNPNTIAAGNTGSLCTATVTDQNGVPLSGVTGATVTFTVSDPTVATILPCTVNIPGAINITTSPNIIPQIVPNTPCATPTAQIPGQTNTFINGQATALLVASNYAHAETVTVTASLGVLIPPSFSCLTSPFTPVSLNQALFGGGIVNSNGLVGVNGGVTGCGLGNPVGFTGLATGLSVAGSGGLTGIVTLPNTTSASTTVNIGGVAGILIAGATTTSPLQLARGCNQVIVTSTNGTPIANIAALVSPTSAVVSIWRFNNGTKQFQAGFFSDPAAPTDYIGTGLVGSTLQGGATINSSAPGAGTQITESYFVCVNQSSTIVSG